MILPHKHQWRRKLVMTTVRTPLDLSLDFREAAQSMGLRPSEALRAAMRSFIQAARPNKGTEKAHEYSH